MLTGCIFSRGVGLLFLEYFSLEIFGFSLLLLGVYLVFLCAYFCLVIFGVTHCVCVCNSTVISLRFYAGDLWGCVICLEF